MDGNISNRPFSYCAASVHIRLCTSAPIAIIALPHRFWNLLRPSLPGSEEASPFYNIILRSEAKNLLVKVKKSRCFAPLTMAGPGIFMCIGGPKSHVTLLGMTGLATRCHLSPALLG
jgi:hypothetical protein